MRRVIHTDRPDAGAYALLNSLVVPRPIAWISTVSAEGVGNLAPHSFFSVACANPPIVSWTSVRQKDTLTNVLATGEFVVNLATLPDIDRVNATSARFDPHHDEASALGIEMEPSERVAPPRVVSSPASLECTLHSTIKLGDSVLVLGDVVAVTVVEDAMDGDHPDFARLQTVSRLGINEWGLPPEVRAVDRPDRPEGVVGRNLSG
jgi:flavin reductase (DIM6/NTAB) family NADH-FMN oxidoreductase RutF